MFEAIEGNFSLQAKFSVTLAGLSGFYMTYRLDAWDRFSDPRFWWMPAMVLVWAVFTFRALHCGTGFSARLVREPRAARSERTFAVVHRAHWVLLMLSVITIWGALGAHGVLF